jgi:hypothetical protein
MRSSRVVDKGDYVDGNYVAKYMFKVPVLPPCLDFFN